MPGGIVRGEAESNPKGSCGPIRLGVLIALTIAGWAPADAACIQPKTFATINAIEDPAYLYINFGDTSPNQAFNEGKVWELGNYAGANNGTYDHTQWLRPPYYSGSGDWYVAGTLDDPGVVGCASGNLVTMVERSRTANFSVLLIDETPTRSQTFDYTRLDMDYPPTPLPAADIIAQNPDGTVDVRLPLLEAGFYGPAGTTASDVISGYLIYTRNGAAGIADDTRTATDWTFVDRADYTGSDVTVLGLSIPCPFGHDALLSAAVEFENGAAQTFYVSLASRIFCGLDPDPDADGFDNDVDNCPDDPNPGQEDVDSDGFGDVCDLCISIPNPSQADRDGDAIGDACDGDDGEVWLEFPATDDRVDWLDEVGADVYHLYRGDLATLKATGIYTQAPGSHPNVGNLCATATSEWLDAHLPAVGTTAYYLASIVSSGAEGSLGKDGDGLDRPNDNPCP